MNNSYIFVYGLLKSTYKNEAATFVRTHAELVGRGNFPGYLYDIGTYPGAVFDETSPHLVHGEIYRITGDVAVLNQFLDEFEGVGPKFEQPNEYVKEVITIHSETDDYEASCYLYNRNSSGLKLIKSGVYDNPQGNRP